MAQQHVIKLSIVFLTRLHAQMTDCLHMNVKPLSGGSLEPFSKKH